MTRLWTMRDLALALSNSCSKPLMAERQVRTRSPKKNPLPSQCQQDFQERAHERLLQSQALLGSTHWQKRQVRGSRSWHYGHSRGLVDGYPTSHFPSRCIGAQQQRPARRQPAKHASVSHGGDQQAAPWKRNGSADHGNPEARRYSPWLKPRLSGPRPPSTLLEAQGRNWCCLVVALVP